MSENLPAPKSGWLPDWFVELKQIPGAVTAIARLVGGAGKAGAAWVDVIAAKGEQKAQAIRDQTGAHTALTKDAVKVAAKQMNKDPELAERAIDHVMAGMIRKQENREAVAMKAIEHLREEPPKEPPSEAPSDDWMNVFEAHVEKASSERMQEHWAQILAGEIRKPGSFSLLTLQFMSVLDKQLAEIVVRNLAYITGNIFLVVPEERSRGTALIDLVTLESLGLLQRNLRRTYEFNDEGAIFLPFGDCGLGIERGKRTNDQVLTLEGAILTRTGQEVVSIIPRERNVEALTIIAKDLAGKGFHVKVLENVKVADGRISAHIVSDHKPEA